MLWLLQTITYEDDYKHRYDSGVYLDEPKIFKSEEEAKNYLKKLINEMISTKISDQGEDYFRHDLKNWRKYLKKVQDKEYDDYFNYELKNIKYIDNVMPFFKGEYVETVFEYSLNELNET